MKSKLAFSLLFSLIVGSLCNGHIRAEEPARASVAYGIIFLPLDFYAKHGEALGLDKDQMREMQQIMEGLREPGEKLAALQGERVTALQEAVAQNPVDREQATERFKAVMQVENEMKTLQFQARMKMRAVLRPEQFEKVRAQVAEAAEKSGDSGALPAKFQKVREAVNQRFGGNVPKELVSKLEKIAESARQGHVTEAEQHLDAVLQYLSDDNRFGKDGVKQQFRMLEEALKTTTDPAKREQIEQKMRQLKESHSVDKSSTDASKKDTDPLEQKIQYIAKMAEQTDNPELREQLGQAIEKLEVAAEAGDKDAVNEILKAVQQLLKDHSKKP